LRLPRRYRGQSETGARNGHATVKVLNAAQAIAEIEMAKGLAFRSLPEKNAVSERNC